MGRRAIGSRDEPDALDRQLIELGEARKHELCRLGQLDWMLDAHQLEIYEAYRAWEAADEVDQGASKIFICDIGRQFGKTWLVSLIKVEDCIRIPRSLHTYACAFTKDIAEIINPAIEAICDELPDDVRPLFGKSREGRSMGWSFPNGSFLKLVGIDRNPRGLRGRASDGIAVSEAGHVTGLAKTLADTLIPQVTRRPLARIILESNAPEDPNHDFDTVFVPDAKMRSKLGPRCYFKRTLADNSAMTEIEKRRVYNNVVVAKGKEVADREFYGIRNRSKSRFIVPEFDEHRHIVPAPKLPEYAHCYISMDPAEDDPLALVFAYFDFERAVLVVQRSFAQRAFRTGELAVYVKQLERDLWSLPAYEGPQPTAFKRGQQPQSWQFEAPEVVLTYWDGLKFQANPYKRVSDVDKHLVGDLSVDYGLHFDITAKSDMRAQLNRLRNAFSQGQIEICDDDPGPLALQLQRCRWNEKFTDWERDLENDQIGHADCIAALMYLWRNVQPRLNPFPPKFTDLKAPGLAVMPWHSEVAEPRTNVAAVLKRNLWGAPKTSRAGRTGRFRR